MERLPTARVRGIVRLLFSRATAAELVPPLLGAIGEVERWEASRRSAVRDPLLAAALFAAAGRDVERVASMVLEALRGLAVLQASAGDGAPAALEPEPSVWTRRLDGWRRVGTTGVMAGLAEWLVAQGEDVPAAGPASGAATVAEWPLQVEARNGHERNVVDASRFLGIERSVRWVPTPSGVLGLVEGRPMRVVGSLLYGGRAIRFDRYGEEVLMPVGPLRVGTFS